MTMLVRLIVLSFWLIALWPIALWLIASSVDYRPRIVDLKRSRLIAEVDRQRRAEEPL